MKNRNYLIPFLGLVALAFSATQARSQSDYATPYAFTNFAGMPGGPGNADGTGNTARFSYPSGVAVDSVGNVYVADTLNFTVRKMTAAGAVTTLAGSPGQQGSNDGTGNVARFDYPSGVAVDSVGNVYVADTLNNTIRKITPAGAVMTLAGSPGPAGSSDGTGSAARFNRPSSVAVDSAGNVYVADSWNSTIRRITPAGEVTTLAGDPGQSGSDDGSGTAARFAFSIFGGGPRGVAVDSADNVYVADTLNNTIRKFTPAGAVTTLAGSAGQQGSDDGAGSVARFGLPAGVAVDSADTVYVADSANNLIRKITPVGAVTTLAGSPGQSGSADGTRSVARFNNPFGVAVDTAGFVYVADALNSTIRRITPSGEVTTLAGSAGQSGSADGSGNTARFNYPWKIAVDSVGNLYVTEGFASGIRKVTPNGVVTTFAGLTAGTGLAVDTAGNLYLLFVDKVQKVTSSGAITTLAGSTRRFGSADGTGSAAEFNEPYGIGVDGVGNVYVAETYNNTIRKITPAGVVTTLAGSTGQIGGVDGVGNAAQFNYPTGVAVDSEGNLYVVDSFNNRITKGTPVFRFQSSPSSLIISNGLFQMRLTGPFNRHVIVESSADLQAWTPVQINALPPDGLDLSVPLMENQKLFFRATLSP